MSFEKKKSNRKPKKTKEDMINLALVLAHDRQITELKKRVDELERRLLGDGK